MLGKKGEGKDGIDKDRDEEKGRRMAGSGTRPNVKSEGKSGEAPTSLSNQVGKGPEKKSRPRKNLKGAGLTCPMGTTCQGPTR